MNMEKSWTIQPWHIKAAFRKCGYIVPEYAITLPDKQIVGPDMSLQGKEFFVTVTVCFIVLCFECCSTLFFLDK